MPTKGNEEFQFSDDPNSPIIPNEISKSMLERAMPILVVILTILVAILLPLTISNHVQINNTKGMMVFLKKDFQVAKNEIIFKLFSVSRICISYQQRHPVFA